MYYGINTLEGFYLSLDTFLQEEPNSSVSVNDHIPKTFGGVGAQMS
jgi:hypothetical protein